MLTIYCYKQLTIMPTLNTGHANAPAIMIGEKGAVLIKAARRVSQPVQTAIAN